MKKNEMKWPTKSIRQEKCSRFYKHDRPQTGQCDPNQFIVRPKKAQMAPISPTLGQKQVQMAPNVAQNRPNCFESVDGQAQKQAKRTQNSSRYMSPKMSLKRPKMSPDRPKITLNRTKTGHRSLKMTPNKVLNCSIQAPNRSQ